MNFNKEVIENISAVCDLALKSAVSDSDFAVIKNLQDRIYDENLIEICKEYADECHEAQMYGDDNYFDGHLVKVHRILQDTLDMHDIRLGTDVRVQLIGACYLHDVLEDCNITYNDLFKNIGDREICDIVYDLTSELGKNREERNKRTYPKIKNNHKAIVVKLCDRIANTSDKNSTMYHKYKQENKEFLEGILPDLEAVSVRAVISLELRELIYHLVQRLNSNFEDK